MINKIKGLLLDNSGKIIPARTNVNFLKKNKIWDFIESSFSDNFSKSEKIYCITHDIKERPKCNCGKFVKFHNGNGYASFCSRKCSSNDPMVLKINKNSVSKALIKAYNENGNNIRIKRKKTLYKNYGEYSDSPFGISVIKDKIKFIIKEKYGVDNIFRLEKYRGGGKAIKQKSIDQWKIKGFDIKYRADRQLTIYNACKIHKEFNIDIINFYNRAARGRQGIICPICNPLNTFSSLESNFEEILISLNINYEKNNRKLIFPQELDFYLPDYKIAFELNGIYWHSEIFKNKNYHKNKKELCLEKGIKLIQIWEDDFYNKKDIVVSMVKNFTQKSDNKIYARKCVIKEISSIIYRNFLELNHLQGKINSSVKLGLFYKDELVCVMGFGKLRKCLGSCAKEGNFELHRFASKINNNIIGGASKLLSYFEKTFMPDVIISYSKRDYSDGNLYEKLGFRLDKICDPGFYWIIDGVRKHRFSYRKNNILKNANDVRSGIQIMHDEGFIRVFDSGNLKFIKKFIVKEN